MDPTSSYYALSTIAQCAAALAALIGFLGLWRLDRLRAEREQALQLIYRRPYMAMDGGVSIADHNACYLTLDEEARRLAVLADLYFPHLQKAVSDLRGEMNVFWGTQRQRLYEQSQAFIDDHRELIEEDPSFQEKARSSSWVEILKISDEIAAKTCAVRQGLIKATESLVRLDDPN